MNSNAVNMRVFEGVCLSQDMIENAIFEAHKPVENSELHPKLLALLNQQRPLQHTPEWFERRKSMLTASNVASFLGVNKYCSKKRFMQKVCDELAKPPNVKTQSPNRGFAACQWGTKHEPEAAVLYSLVTGHKCYPEDVGLINHPTKPFLGASPDRVLCDQPVLVEIKAPFKRQIQPTEIPPMYIPQVQTQLEVCDMTDCHFVQFLPATLCSPGILSILNVPRDNEWWRQNMQEISTFTEQMHTVFDNPNPNPAKKRKVVTTSSTQPTSTSTQPETTVSPGVYNVYIDERIQISKEFEDLLSKLIGVSKEL